jgi:NAD binding domain of 6-phosphogluconate dehydrogenase
MLFLAYNGEQTSSSPLPHRKADIALIGLAVMGQNLILNMDSKGFVVCAYNRTVDKVSSECKAISSPDWTNNFSYL